MKFWKHSPHAVAALLASASLANAAASEDSAAIADPDSAVLRLNSKNFQETLENNPLVLVEFFAPWCGHCKTLGPEFSKAADSLKENHPKIKLGQVNCVEEEQLCRQHEIRGYPTLKLARGIHQQPDDYDGPRDSAGIVDYVVKMSKPPVQIISDIHKFVNDTISELKPFVVQILPSAASTDSIAAALNETFGDIAQLQRRLRSHFSIEDDEAIAAFNELVNVDLSGDKPKYLVIHPNELNDVRLFDGEDITKESLMEWTSNAQVPAFGDINRDTYLIYMGSSLPLGYYFYKTPEERKSVAEFFEKKGKELRGKINFVGLDANLYGRHAEILNMNPDIVPLFAIQNNANGKKYGLDQTENPSPSIKAIEKFIGQFLAGEVKPIIKSEPLPSPEDEDYDEDVVKLVAHNYEDILNDLSKSFIVEYFAPWCGHCKKLAPTWKDLGAHYRGKGDSVVVAKVDHTLNDVTTPFQIEGYPTIIFYPANGEVDKKSGMRKAIAYNKGRDFDSLLEFIEEHSVADSSAAADAAEPEAEAEAEAEPEASGKAEVHDEL